MGSVNILSAMLLFGIVFSFFNLFFAFKKWLKLRKYQYITKGTVEEVSLYDNKIALNIKWHIPNELIQVEENNSKKSTAQYYTHIAKKIAKLNEKKEAALIDQMKLKFMGQPFYLLLKEQKGVIREIQPFAKPLGFALLNLLICGALIVGIFYI